MCLLLHEPLILADWNSILRNASLLQPIVIVIVIHHLSRRIVCVVIMNHTDNFAEVIPDKMLDHSTLELHYLLLMVNRHAVP
jgi:hypothetical protein